MKDASLKELLYDIAKYDLVEGKDIKDHPAHIAATKLDLLVEHSKKQAAELKALKTPQLLNLLARIHRDRGQYTKTHGLAKSCEDANTIVVELLAKDG